MPEATHHLCKNHIMSHPSYHPTSLLQRNTCLLPYQRTTPPPPFHLTIPPRQHPPTTPPQPCHHLFLPTDQPQSFVLPTLTTSPPPTAPSSHTFSPLIFHQSIHPPHMTTCHLPQTTNSKTTGPRMQSIFHQSNTQVLRHLTSHLPRTTFLLLFPIMWRILPKPPTCLPLLTTTLPHRIMRVMSPLAKSTYHPLLLATTLQHSTTKATSLQARSTCRLPLLATILPHNIIQATSLPARSTCHPPPNLVATPLRPWTTSHQSQAITVPHLGRATSHLQRGICPLPCQTDTYLQNTTTCQLTTHHLLKNTCRPPWQMGTSLPNTTPGDSSPPTSQPATSLLVQATFHRTESLHHLRNTCPLLHHQSSFLP